MTDNNFDDYVYDNTNHGTLALSTENTYSSQQLSNESLKLDMFLNELKNLSHSNLDHTLLNNNILKELQFEDNPQDPYDKCFSKEFCRSIPISFSRGYEKNC